MTTKRLSVSAPALARSAPQAETDAAAGAPSDQTPAAATLPRFSGAEAWAKLSPANRATLGAIALEHAVATMGYFVVTEMPGRERHRNPQSRAVEAAYQLSSDQLVEYVATVIGLDADALPPVPSCIGPVCRVCGCSQEDACESGCWWIAEDLCSACEGR